MILSPNKGIGVTVPSGYDGIERVYGKFEWHDVDNDPGAAVTIDPDWTRAHVATLLPSELPPGLLPKPVYVHRLVKEPFRQAMIAANAAKPTYKIFSAVSFVPRHKLHRRGESLSLHSWGIAIDLNPRTNKYSAGLALPPEMNGSPSIDWSRYYDIPNEYVAVFEKEGFVWGGRWRLPDPMHFQLAQGA